MTSMRFEKESDMMPYVARVARQLVRANSTVYVFTECPATPGIADVVFASFSQKAIERRLENDLPPLPKVAHTKVLSVLSKSTPCDLLTVAKVTGYSIEYLRRSVMGHLLDQGYARMVNSSFLLNPGFFPVATRIAAVEMKRETWAHGLYQARRYLRFANKVFLALDESFAHRVLPYVEDIRKQSVGIMLVDRAKARPRIVCAPPAAQPRSRSDRLLIEERLWQQLRDCTCQNLSTTTPITTITLPRQPGDVDSFPQVDVPGPIEN